MHARSGLSLIKAVVKQGRCARRGIGDFPIPPKHKGEIQIRDVESRQKLAALAHNANPWTRVQDPKGSGGYYWWNQRTNQTTALGAPRPAVWLRQLDPAGSGQIYWWNPETNETTALNEPDPSTNELMNSQGPFNSYAVGPPITFSQALKQYAVVGASMSVAFALIGVLFR